MENPCSYHKNKAIVDQLKLIYSIIRIRPLIVVMLPFDVLVS